MEKDESSAPHSAEAGYLFGNFFLDAAGELFRGDRAMKLPKAELCVLHELISHAGDVVPTIQLARAIGGTRRRGGGYVADVVASLADHLGIAHCVEPVYKRGFRFRGEVKRAVREEVGKQFQSEGNARRGLVRMAVLPLDGSGGIAQNLSEAIAAEATRILRSSGGELEVVEPESVIVLARRGQPPRVIGQALNAHVVLAGTVQTLPAGVRIHARMIQVASNDELWAEDLLVPVEQAGQLGEKLAERVELRMGFGINLAASSGDNPVPQGAKELLWRARAGWRSMQRHQMQDAARDLRLAIEMAPRWMDARLELVELYMAQAVCGYMAPEAVSAQIKRVASAEVLRLEGGTSLLPVLGWVYFHIDRDLQAAREAFGNSCHVPYAPGLAHARTDFALSRHSFDQAIQILRQDLRLDPYSASLHAHLVWALHLAGQADESVRMADFALSEFGETDCVELCAAIVLAWNGQAVRAAGIAENLTRRCPYLDHALAVQAYALAKAERPARARDLLEQLQWLSRERFVQRCFTVAAYQALGEPDAAMEELRACQLSRSPWFFQLLSDPQLNSLRGRSDFQALAAILPRMEAEPSGAAGE